MPGLTPDHRAPIVVLLVDDQRFVGVALSRLIGTEADIELHCCYDALQAIKEANHVAPTVILQDLVMPNSDGLTLVGMYRANQITANTPVIVLSGNDDADTRARASAAGAIDYLVKLPAKADLLACIRRHSSHGALDPKVIAVFQQAGTPDFIVSLIDQFMLEAESHVGALKDASRRLDRATLKATAHSLKGSSSIMGATRLAALCSEVEDELTSHVEGGLAPALLAAVDKELIQVRDAFAAHRQSNNESDGPRS